MDGLRTRWCQATSFPFASSPARSSFYAARAVEVVPQVVLARPRHLDRGARRLRDLAASTGSRGCSRRPKPPPSVHDVHDRPSPRAGRGASRRRPGPSAAPGWVSQSSAAVRGDARRAVLGLHGGVGQEGQAVDRSTASAPRRPAPPRTSPSFCAGAASAAPQSASSAQIAAESRAPFGPRPTSPASASRARPRRPAVSPTTATPEGTPTTFRTPGTARAAAASKPAALPPKTGRRATTP